MKDIYFQLNSLAVLIGISIAIIQYVFTNHQNTLKDILSNLKKIEFKKDNPVDSALGKQWEEVIRNCKAHSYIVEPNRLIGAGFFIILLLVLLFNFVLFEPLLVEPNTHPISSVVLMLLTGFLALFLIASSVLIYQIFSKESKVKKEFKNIENQHNMVDRVLSSS